MSNNDNKHNTIYNRSTYDIARDKEIVKLSDQVSQTATLFSELQLLIADQAVIIENIESNIGDAHNDVKKGKDNLEIVNERKTTICSFSHPMPYFIIINFIGFVFFVIYIVLKQNNQ